MTTKILTFGPKIEPIDWLPSQTYSVQRAETLIELTQVEPFDLVIVNGIEPEIYRRFLKAFQSDSRNAGLDVPVLVFMETPDPTSAIKGWQFLKLPDEPAAFLQIIQDALLPPAPDPKPISNEPIRSLGWQFIVGLISTGLGKASIIVLGMLGLIITTRVLPPEEVGVFVLLQVIVIFLTEVSNFGITLAIPRFISSVDDPAAASRLISTAVYFRLITIVLTIIFALVGSSALFSLFGGGSYHPELMIYIPILVTLESLGKLIYAVLQGTFKFKIIGYSSALSSVVNFAGIILLVLVVKGNLHGLVFAKLASRVLAFGYAYIAGHIRIEPVFDRKDLRKLLVFGLPLEVNYLQSFLYQRFDTFLIGILMGPADVALYEVARRIPDSGMEGYDAFNQVYFPFISRLFDHQEMDKLAQVINTATRWITFVCMFGTLIALTFGREIITMLFSDTYEKSAAAFWLLMVGLMVMALDSTLGYSLVAIGEATKLILVNTFRSLILVVLYVVLIIPYGMVGGAIAGALGVALMNPIYIYFLLRKKVKVDVMAYMKPILIFSLFAILFQWLSPSPAERLLLVVVYLISNVAASVVTKDEIALAWTYGKKLLSNYRKSSLRHVKSS